MDTDESLVLANALYYGTQYTGEKLQILLSSIDSSFLISYVYNTRTINMDSFLLKKNLRDLFIVHSMFRLTYVTIDY